MENLEKVSKERLQEIYKESPEVIYEKFGTVWGIECSKEQAKVIAEAVKQDGLELVKEKYGFRLDVEL